jgi:hypothetical protein
MHRGGLRSRVIMQVSFQCLLCYLVPSSKTHPFLRRQHILKQVGHATFDGHAPRWHERGPSVYLITLSRLHIELTNTSCTQSSSGWLSVIKYQGTPPIGSGSSFQASSFEGQWNTTSKDLQSEWESRALWLKVAKGQFPKKIMFMVPI